ncbi:MAG: MFS transporter [Thermomicrobiales bacterium]|nr:MFS transporter [Thermomicrobiales bacterium]
MTTGESATPSEASPDAVVDPPRDTARFGALEVTVFRNYFLATIVSNIGSWMQILAQGWLILELTDSPFYLGLVGLVRAVPTIGLSLVGGVLADRFSRTRILMITQSVMALSSLVIAILTVAGVITVWHLLVISFISSVFFSVDNPTRQALVPDLVGRDKLASAIGLNSAAWNAAAIIGPSVAGVLIAAVSISGAFFLNAASYIPVLIVVGLIPRVERKVTASRSMSRQLSEGLSYIRSDRIIWGILLLIAIPSVVARPYTQMMPVFARDVLGLGATGFGVLMAASGLGALVGALITASLGGFAKRGWLLVINTIVLGITLVGFAQSRWIIPSIILVIFVGGTSTLMMSLANTLLQGLVPDAMRGRVMSVYTLIAGGLMPLGSMILGAAGEAIGVPLAVGIGGIITIIVALGFVRGLEDVRHVR